MYRLGRRSVHHYLLLGLVVLCAAALLAGTIIAGRAYFQPHTILKQAPPVTHTVAGDEPATRQTGKSVFSMQLPIGWQEAAAPQIHYNIYSWVLVGKHSDGRRLDVYVDTIPPDLAFNHLLPVEPMGDRLEIVSPVSDNCTTFTDKTPASATTGAAVSKWGGVNFLCDVANYERDVVGIGSAEGVNQVTLRGPTTGSHRILLVYTDYSVTPDYAIFTAIVKSFRLL